MCFSASASFLASAALGGIGALAVRRAKSRRALPFAAIPFFFGLQQATEGVVWLEVSHAPFSKTEGTAVRIFLFFALFLWPIYVPAALAAAEDQSRRRRVLVALALIGAGVGAYLFRCASVRATDACIAFDNLYYWVQLDSFTKPFAAPLYSAVVVSALITSSKPGTTIVGVVLVASSLVTGLIYRAGFISIWCFVCAILSSLVLRAVPRWDGSSRSVRG